MPTGAKNDEGRPQGQPSSEHCSRGGLRTLTNDRSPASTQPCVELGLLCAGVLSRRGALSAHVYMHKYVRW
jgi:hypothetical protein